MSAAPERLGDGSGIFDRGDFVGRDEADPEVVDACYALLLEDLLDGALNGGGNFVQGNAWGSHVDSSSILSQFEQVFYDQRAQGSTRVPPSQGEGQLRVMQKNGPGR